MIVDVQQWLAVESNTALHCMTSTSRYCAVHRVFSKSICQVQHFTISNHVSCCHSHSAIYKQTLTIRIVASLTLWSKATEQVKSYRAHLNYSTSGLAYAVEVISLSWQSLSTPTAESEIKAVNQCLKEEALALRVMLILMGFPQDATIIEEDNQARVYASKIPHMTRGMRHLDLAELLIKEKVDAKEIKLLSW